MDTGQKVSGVAHIGLIVWVMVFDIFQAPDSSAAVPATDVSLISSEDFAALSGPRPEAAPAPQPAPEPEPEPEPAAPQAPAPEPEPEPEIRAPDPVAPEPPQPVEEPAPQPAPEP
ncbi:MAG: cell envelope biogenesis protein TolA, partial [Roseinatronobacter sp.]